MNETPLQQIHRPSRATAFAFFGFSLAAAAFVVVWVFFLNKGTLVIDGETPFRINVAGHEKQCQKSPCSLQLSPRKYSLGILKEGYYEDTQETEIKRWGETKVSAHFIFIPVMAETGGLVLPFRSAPLRPPFLGNKSFENFPQAAKEVYFSGNGARALVFLGKEIYLYDVEKHTLSGTDFRASSALAWVSDDIVFLDAIESKHMLKILKEQKSELVVTFERPFKNPKLIGSPTERKVLVVDEVNGFFQYYLVDIAKKSRRRLAIEGSASDVKWAGPYIIFAAGEDADKKIFALHAETGKQIFLPAAHTENVIERKSGVLLFFSTEKGKEVTGKFGASISEALEVAKKETAPTNQIPKTLFLTEFTMEDGSERTLASIALKNGETPKKLTLDPSQKKIYFEMGGRLFEIILEK